MDTSKLTEIVRQMRLDVDGLSDPVVREVVGQVLNLVEEVVAEDQRLREEIARLHDILRKAHLKPPPPTTPAANSAGTGDTATANAPSRKTSVDRSSEKERRSREGRNPRSPRADRRSFRPVHVDRDVVCPVEPNMLPPDATFVGYDDVVVQDLIVRTDNVRYRREIWQSPTQGRFCGSLPTGVRGEYGSRLRTLLASLKYVAGTSLPRAQALVEHFDIVISSASVVNILHDAAERLKPEREAILRAGLAATSYQHVDDTSCRVGG